MDKLSQKNRLLKLFRDNGNIISLGEIMKTDLACEYRKWISILRKDPLYEIPEPVLDRKNPSNNLYTLIEADPVRSQISPVSEGNPKDTHSTLKPDSIEFDYASLSVEDKIIHCRQIQEGYLRSCPEWDKIESQIEGLKAKLVEIKH